LLGVILAAVFIQQPAGLREVVMLAAAVTGYFITPKPVHEANDFQFEPIREVAWLFVGIFATMVAALDYLEIHAAALGIDTPGKFYWLTGTVSATLDNAPTYLTFLAAATGERALSLNAPDQVRQFVAQYPQDLIAISLGAVFFGAMTYIGNGPNFMVKTIAEQHGVRMPSFFGYMLWSGIVLLPVFVVVTLLFFR